MTNNIADETFYTPREAAHILGVDRATIYRWLEIGVLRGIRVGPRNWRIARREIKRLLELGDKLDMEDT